MRILLIGGNGFIGRPLARQLQQAGQEVAILHRSARTVGNLRTIEADRNDLAACRDAMRAFSPEVIVDLILSSGEQAQQLMEVARGIARRVVALSSGDVYRAWGVFKGIEPELLEPLPITEDSPRRTVRRLYAAEAMARMQSIFSWFNDDYDKVAVEDAVMNSREVAGTVLRLPMVYGPGDRLHRFFPVLKRIADGRRVIILPDNFAAWRAPRGYVENVAHAIAVATTREEASGRIYNVCEEPCWSEVEWQKKVAGGAGWTGTFATLPPAQAPAHLRVPENTAQHVVVSSDRIRRELGYTELVSTTDAIRRTIEWERENPPPAVDSQQFDYAAEDQALAGAA